MATATQPKQHETQTAAAPTKSVLDQVLEKSCEYTPFMAKDAIKLSANLVLSHLCKPTKSGKVCTKQDAERFIMLCQARGLNPWEGDAFIIGYDGKDGPEFSLVTAHQAFLKRAEVHAEYEGMESGVTVRDGEGVLHDIPGDYVDDGLTLVGGWARVHFKTRKIPMYRRLRLATFNKNRSRWNVDAAGMIVKCAEADALRSSFPNTLGGMYLADEMPDSDAARGEREPVPMPRAVEAPLHLPKAAHAATNGHAPELQRDAEPDEQTQPEPAESAPSDSDAALATPEQLAVLEKLAAQQGTLHKWRKYLQELYGIAKPDAALLTAEQATAEHERLSAVLSGAEV